MKIRTEKADYRTVMALPRPAHRKPLRPGFLFRTLMRVASIPDLVATRFSYVNEVSASLLDQPCLILMNHSCFLDLEIAARILFPHPYGIICTSDGFVGKEAFMRRLGCIPTQKYVTDMTLIRDMKYALREKKMSVLMYPEASYSFDGRPTPLPDSLPGLLKLLDVPVLMIRTEGAFLRDPLYNGLQKRKVRVSARFYCLATPEQIRESSPGELGDLLRQAFAMDYFHEQAEHGVRVKEPFRADGLERILYTCPVCGQEGKMEGKGTRLTCHACGASWQMDDLGRMEAEKSTAGWGGFAQIPDWYDWERQLVRQSLEDGTYRLDVPVRIGMMVDYKAIYMVGEGRLIHDGDGFCLTGCDGALHYTQKPLASYGLYADYFWYELGDVICIGNQDALYYCFPPAGTPVAKARLAAEELFRMRKAQKRIPLHQG